MYMMKVRLDKRFAHYNIISCYSRTILRQHYIATALYCDSTILRQALNGTITNTLTLNLTNTLSETLTLRLTYTLIKFCHNIVHEPQLIIINNFKLNIISKLMLIIIIGKLGLIRINKSKLITINKLL